MASRGARFRYRVGVAPAGNHDSAVSVPMWAEQYHGDLSEEGRVHRPAPFPVGP